MTHYTTQIDGGVQLMALLERHRNTLPFAEEELARHTLLRGDIESRRRRDEETLNAWRAALSRRWECEVQGQRAYTSVWRLLSEHYADDTSYLEMVAPSRTSAITPSELLADLRRLEASIALLHPRPPFAHASLRQLGAAIFDLAEAIEQTSRCEAARRSVLAEQRLANNMYIQVCGRTRRLLSDYFGDSLNLPHLSVSSDED